LSAASRGANVSPETKAAHVTLEPTVMPADRESWARQIHLSKFIDSYSQCLDISDRPHCKRVLNIGPGQGVDTRVFRWRSYDVTAYDIGETFRSDHQGSVSQLDAFSNGQFDFVTADNILEHPAVTYLEQLLIEIAPVRRYALIYQRPAEDHGRKPAGGSAPLAGV